MTDPVAKLRRQLAAAQKKSTRASEARARLPSGSSRARVTSANARWMRAAEERDRILRVLADAEGVDVHRLLLDGDPILAQDVTQREEP